MLIKLIFGLSWLGILVAASCGVYLSIFPEVLTKIDFHEVLVRGGILGISSIYIILFFEKTILLFQRPKEIAIKTQNGILKISSSSINNIIKEAVLGHPKVRNVKVKNFAKRKKLKIIAIIDIASNPELSKDLAEIQGEIKKRVEGYLDLEVSGIELKVNKITKER